MGGVEGDLRKERNWANTVFSQMQAILEKHTCSVQLIYVGCYLHLGSCKVKIQIQK